ncbi:MAG: hypothetical protein APR63_04980 [Desulfuromonas sp. SDB]|nr:MAG: hypothetical protein APR63_04980 [Desulfuromonas sp. SDB]
MRVKKYSLHKILKYSISGKCESCGNSYSFSKDVNVGMTRQTRPDRYINPSDLVEGSLAITKRTFWDILKNVFSEPHRFGVDKPCPSCGHIQSWIRLNPVVGSKKFIGLLWGLWLIVLIIFLCRGYWLFYLLISVPLIIIVAIILRNMNLDRIFKVFSNFSSKPVITPTAPNLVIISPSPDPVSTQDYPPEIPFTLDHTVQASLFKCEKSGVPKIYVKYLGTMIMTTSSYKLSNSERESILKTIGYFEIIKNASVRHKLKLTEDILFAVSMRINKYNWKNIARLVEDYQLRFVQPEKIMKLLIPADRGGIGDEELEDRKFTESYFKVDRRKKEIVICPECKKQMLIPVEPLPPSFTCPHCRVTKRCSWHQFPPNSPARHIRLE